MSRNNIMFDLDGTLTDPMEGITKSVQYALKSFGINIADNRELCCFIGPPLGESFMKYYGFDREKTEKAIEKYREYFVPTGIFENELYDGVDGMLADLKKAGKRIFMVTGKPTVFARRIAEHFKIDGYFTDIRGIDLSEIRKPKCETLKGVMTDYNIRPDDAVMVGDRIFDIDAGRRNNVFTVGVEYGFAEPGEFANAADGTVGSVDELKKLLLKI